MLALREERERQGRTIAEIAAATRINAKYIEELERTAGPKTFSLGPIYYRTFSRAYARELGIEIQEELAPPPEPAPEVKSYADIASSPPVEESVSSPLPSSFFKDGTQMRATAIIVGFLILALFLSIRWLGGKEETGEAGAPGSSSGPAGQAGTGQSESAPPATGGTGGSGGGEPGAKPASPESGSAPRSDRKLTAFSQEDGTSDTAGGQPSDSLVLVATTTESVWVHIVVDNGREFEYTLPPRYSVTLKARDNFLLAVGNPAGMSISLNGKNLGVLGEGGRPRKNILVSRKLLSDQ
jgi:cytoskeletal protein RodZ